MRTEAGAVGPINTQYDWGFGKYFIEVHAPRSEILISNERFHQFD